MPAHRDESSHLVQRPRRAPPAPPRQGRHRRRRDEGPAAEPRDRYRRGACRRAVREHQEAQPMSLRLNNENLRSIAETGTGMDREVTPAHVSAMAEELLRARGMLRVARAHITDNGTYPTF